MKLRTILLTITCITILAVTTTVQAASFAIPPLPTFPSNEWTPGSSITYSGTLSQGPDAMNFDMRVAVLGKEHEQATNTDLCWIEFDFTGISGLSPDIQQFFMDNYSELPTSIRVNMLIPEYDLNVIVTDPTKAYLDFSSPGFVRKTYFQYNRWTPWDVDPFLITGLVLPYGVTMMLRGDTPDDFVQTRDMKVDLVPDSQKFVTENSDSTTTTPAGDFSGKMYTYTSRTGGSSASIFYSAAPPIFPFVTFSGLWPRDNGDISLVMELKSIQESGAATGIVGQPQVINLQTLMSGG